MQTKFTVVIYSGIALFTVSPLICAALAVAISSVAGAELDEGSPHPCIVSGVDIGPALYKMFTAGWYFFFTAPAGLFALIAFTLYLWLFGK